VTATVPMKVYRGRARGSNAPAAPTHVWTGALSDALTFGGRCPT